MTPEQTLFAALFLIYVSDCLAWGHAHVIRFHRRGGDRWGWSQPGAWFGNDQGGLAIQWLLPPFGTEIWTAVWPLALTPHGAVPFSRYAWKMLRRPDQTGAPLWFDDGSPAIHGEAKKVFVDGRYFLTAISESAAKWVVNTLDRVRRLPREHRQGAIDRALQASLDTRAVDRRMTEFRGASAILSLTANLLWTHLFVVSPYVVSTRGLGKTWTYLLIVLLLLWSLVAWSFFHGYRRLYPDARGARWRKTLILLLNPLGAIRAGDVLSREVLTDFHPLAVAWVLLTPESFAEFARGVWRDTKYPLPIHEIDVTPDAQRLLDDYQAWYAPQLAEFLSELGLDTVDLERVAATDPQSRSYCPRCGGEFVIPEGLCELCGGLTLRPFTTWN